MKKIILLSIFTSVVTGCSSVNIEKTLDTVPAEDAVIQNYDDDEQYSTALQLMYLGTQEDPDANNNIDKLSIDYYKDMENHNNTMALASIGLLATKALSNMDLFSFFFATQQNDRLNDAYKIDDLLFIEPFNNGETPESAYLRTFDKLKSIAKQAYGDGYYYKNYTSSFFGKIIPRMIVWDNTTPQCAVYLKEKSELFTESHWEIPKELRVTCLKYGYGFDVLHHYVIKGEVNIDGVPKAEKYFVALLKHSDPILEKELKNIHVKNVYAYQPPIAWNGRGDNVKKDEKERLIKEGLISPYPYLLRLEDSKVYLFKK